MKLLNVDLHPSYPIYIGSDSSIKNIFQKYCQQSNKRLAVITDTNIYNLYGQMIQANLNCDILVIPSGDQHKTRETKQKLEDSLFEKQYGRDTCLIALGGGVVTDIVGYLSSTYCRGISTIYYPTSLIGMVDASIGGKTGVNTPHGKNMVGTFYQPSAVFINIDMLNTLPEKEWKNGISEVIKYGLIADGNLFNLLECNLWSIRDISLIQDIIITCCSIKKCIIEKDEKENGLRQLLNFGHTIGHAIEVTENYSITHGEAVAIGMVIESYISYLHGYLSKNIFGRIYNIISNYKILNKSITFNKRDKFHQYLSMDKKVINGKVRFVLLDGIGRPHHINNLYSEVVDKQVVNEALNWYEQNILC
jgi:3-dehydroquinate synthase